MPNLLRESMLEIVATGCMTCCAYPLVYRQSGLNKTRWKALFVPGGNFQAEGSQDELPMYTGPGSKGSAFATPARDQGLPGKLHPAPSLQALGSPSRPSGLDASSASCFDAREAAATGSSAFPGNRARNLITSTRSSLESSRAFLTIRAFRFLAFFNSFVILFFTSACSFCCFRKSAIVLSKAVSRLFSEMNLSVSETRHEDEAAELDTRSCESSMADMVRMWGAGARPGK